MTEDVTVRPARAEHLRQNEVTRPVENRFDRRDLISGQRTPQNGNDRNASGDGGLERNRSISCTGEIEQFFAMLTQQRLVGRDDIFTRFEKRPHHRPGRIDPADQLHGDVDLGIVEHAGKIIGEDPIRQRDIARFADVLYNDTAEHNRPTGSPGQSRGVVVQNPRDTSSHGAHSDQSNCQRRLIHGVRWNNQQMVSCGGDADPRDLSSIRNESECNRFRAKLTAGLFAERVIGSIIVASYRFRGYRCRDLSRSLPKMAFVPNPPLRVGAVNYLNSKPLIEGLAGDDVELLLDYPSRLADGLAAGRYDVALVPSIECLRNAEYEVISDACVAARGPVVSVKLYSRVPPPEIRSVALDEGSRTSAALVRILLAERYGIHPEPEPLPLGDSVSSTEADAVLLIGDRAFGSMDEPFDTTWDLGEEWLNWTGLPFVFACWAARTDTELAGAATILSEARDRGTSRLEEIARREASRLGISEPTAIRYLTENLHFQMGPAERRGLKLFHELAVRGDLADRGAERVFRD